MFDGLQVGDSDCAKKQRIDQQLASLNLHLVLLLLDSLPYTLWLRCVLSF